MTSRDLNLGGNNLHWEFWKKKAADTVALLTLCESKRESDVASKWVTFLYVCLCVTANIFHIQETFK